MPQKRPSRSSKRGLGSLKVAGVTLMQQCPQETLTQANEDVLALCNAAGVNITMEE